MAERAERGRSVDVFLEIPRGSRTKYELDPKSGHLRLDGVLFSSIRDPADYGFVMDTLALDGDPLDALVVVEEPAFPGCVVPPGRSARSSRATRSASTRRRGESSKKPPREVPAVGPIGRGVPRVSAGQTPNEP